MEEKIEEKEEVLKMRQLCIKGEEEDRKKLEKETKKRLDFANGLKAGVNSKQGKTGKDRADQASIGAVAKMITEEYRKEQSEKRERKEKEGSVIRKSLAAQVAQKNVWYIS